MKDTTKIIDIEPAIATALLKAPHASQGGAILKAAAAKLPEGISYVTGTVVIAGYVKRWPNLTKNHTKIDRKGVANVFNWALQRMNQVEYDALIRDLDAIKSGDKRDNEHADRVTEIMEAMTTRSKIPALGKVEWTGEMVIDDLHSVNDQDESDILGSGLTLIQYDEVVGGE